MSLRRSVLTAKFPHGELSVRRSVRTAKSPTAKCPTAKSPTAKSPGTPQTHPWIITFSMPCKTVLNTSSAGYHHAYIDDTFCMILLKSTKKPIKKVQDPANQNWLRAKNRTPDPFSTVADRSHVIPDHRHKYTRPTIAQPACTAKYGQCCCIKTRVSMKELALSSQKIAFKPQHNKTLIASKMAHFTLKTFI